MGIYYSQYDGKFPLINTVRGLQESCMEYELNESRMVRNAGYSQKEF